MSEFHYGKPKWMREIFNEKGSHVGWEEVKPVRGEWVKADYELHNGYMCSVCHEEVLMMDEMTPLENDMIFCPYCGTDMRGETDG